MELVGLEPTTSAMPLQRSSKLSYSPTFSKDRDQNAFVRKRGHLSQPTQLRQATLWIEALLASFESQVERFPPVG